MLSRNRVDTARARTDTHSGSPAVTLAWTKNNSGEMVTPI